MTSPRRKFTEEEKMEILQKAGRLGITAVLHEYHLSYSVFARWKKQMVRSNNNSQDLAASNRMKQELKQLQDENIRLKRIIADQALELERKEEDLRKYRKG